MCAQPQVKASQLKSSPAKQTTPIPQIQEKGPEPDEQEEDAVLLSATGADDDDTTTMSRGESSIFGLLNGFLLLIGTALLHFGYSS
ncbi:unnamed protein product [Dibothriocephalus latus]|uniref:Uncharacterized protein n=1 Tax=Dibothriocephalus latus TaxID=60516 RepID=A0A3P7PJR4_DIBLA|nr:unnamed protein product [Dibothriocephalus latus]